MVGVHKGLRFSDALLTDASPVVRGAAYVYLHEVATTQTRDLRTRLGWALVEVGLRLAAAAIP
ncbi:hypothetical protein [Streptomyces sp. NPDC055400]